MDAQAVEKTLHHNHAIFTCLPRPMIVEQHLRLLKAHRKSVPWNGTIQGAAAVGHQPALMVVDRNRDPPAHHSTSLVITHSEVGSRGGIDPAPGQVGMRV